MRHVTRHLHQLGQADTRRHHQWGSPCSRGRTCAFCQLVHLQPDPQQGGERCSQDQRSAVDPDPGSRIYPGLSAPGSARAAPCQRHRCRPADLGHHPGLLAGKYIPFFRRLTGVADILSSSPASLLSRSLAGVTTSVFALVQTHAAVSLAALLLASPLAPTAAAPRFACLGDLGFRLLLGGFGVDSR